MSCTMQFSKEGILAFSCWYLPEDEATRLLALFPAAYPDVIAHHVTVDFGKFADLSVPPEATIEIVGIADDNRGVQALVVRVNGSTDRPQGGTYHITWSIDTEAGRKPVDSNGVIAEHGWQDVTPVSVETEPKIF
jgi:hypothetical protein